MTKHKWTRVDVDEVLDNQFLTPPDFSRPVHISEYPNNPLHPIELWIYYDKTGQGWVEFYHVESHVWRGGPVDLDVPDWETAVLTLARLLGWSYRGEDGQMDTV